MSYTTKKESISLRGYEELIYKVVNPEAEQTVNGLSGDKRLAVLEALKGAHETEIDEALRRSTTLASEALRDFYWDLNYVLSSDKVEGENEPLLHLVLNTEVSKSTRDRIKKQRHLEFDISRLDQLIERMERVKDELLLLELTKN